MTEGQNENTASGKRTSEYTFCPLCEMLVDLYSLERAATHCNADAEEISRLIQTRSLHCLHNSKGEVLICFNSLQNAYDFVRETAPLKSLTVGKNE
jgi:mannose/fructose/N-acetylgalactosamine-specific phosphotransferase system component IIB